MLQLLREVKGETWGAHAPKECCAQHPPLGEGPKNKVTEATVS